MTTGGRRRLARWSLLLGAFGLAACDDAPRAAVALDLDGPRGAVEAPGPWTIHAFTSDDRPVTLWAAVDDAPLAALGTGTDPAGGVWALLPAAPPGAVIRYYAAAGALREPAEGERHVTVRAPREIEPPTPPPMTCSLAFRFPVDGLQLAQRDDDAPQAGVQITALLQTDLPDGAPARLVAGDRGYAASAAGGRLVFGGIDVPRGTLALVAEATPRGGTPCRAEVTVRR
ncbi:MAG: hypothetical protein H6706_14865 [Myxococcales bacterium]|nr:hypothetical protein [Myxococcales bacterium]